MEGTALQAGRVSARRLLQAAGLLLALAGTAAPAAPMMRDAGGPKAAAAQVAHPAARVVAPAQALRLVWQGADIDGDGQPDFANPTGKDTRKTDAYGCGQFGAPRDGGARRHEGVDFMADAGQPLVAPISGYVTRIGFAYPGDGALKFVEISNPALRYAARVFYVDPTVTVGQAVHVGEPIGRHHTLEQKYPDGMTDHVHLELIDARGAHIDAARLITAHYEPVRAGALG